VSWSSVAALVTALSLLACASESARDANEQPKAGVATASATATTSSHDAAASASAAAASAAASASVSAAPDPLTAPAILDDATFLASPGLRGRGSASEDEEAAAAWLAGELEDAGIPPYEGRRIEPFKFGKKTERQSRNVLGVIEPHGADRKEVVVLGAHYDHLGEHNKKLYPGAEDNASGTAVVLAVARALRARRGELGRRVVIAFFGAEELGLHGSRALVKDWDFTRRPVTAMVNVDMIGRPLVDMPAFWLGARLFGVMKDVDPERSVGVLISDAPPEGFEQAVRTACASQGVRAVLPKDLPSSLRGQVEAMAKGRSDHAPFEDKKVPFVFFSSGESTDYHEPTDTADRLHPLVLERRARAILETVIAVSK
jgi:hypothetical protein